MAQFSGLAESINRIGDRRRQGQQDSINALVQQVALKQAGFELKQERGRFGGLFGGGQLSLQQTPQEPLPPGLVDVRGKVMQEPGFFNPEKITAQAEAEAKANAQAFANSPLGRFAQGQPGQQSQSSVGQTTVGGQQQGLTLAEKQEQLALLRELATINQGGV